MPDSPSLDPSLSVGRKDQHLDLVLAGRGQGGAATGFDEVRFEHCALPDLSLDDIDISATLLGKRLRAPLLISAMTGGPARAADINVRLAEAAEALGLALAVGSQRVALEGGPSGGLDPSLRKHAPTAPILANFGAAQLALGWGADEARRAAEMIGADALVIHLNPLQEAVQPEGDRDWRGVGAALEALVKASDTPVIVKETGCGISAAVARRLAEMGVAGIDVAGAGGTNWALIEAGRSADEIGRSVGDAFAAWGVPTARSIVEVRAACPELLVIGSGGVRDGLDVARAIRLGADLAGQAAGVIKAATISTQAVIDHFNAVGRQLRVACFCTNSPDLSALRRAPLL